MPCAGADQTVDSRIGETLVTCLFPADHSVLLRCEYFDFSDRCDLLTVGTGRHRFQPSCCVQWCAHSAHHCTQQEGLAKAVAHRADGGDPRGPFFSEFGPETTDMNVDRAGAAVVVISPHLGEELLS